MYVLLECDIPLLLYLVIHSGTRYKKTVLHDIPVVVVNDDCLLEDVLKQKNRL